MCANLKLNFKSAHISGNKYAEFDFKIAIITLMCSLFLIFSTTQRSFMMMMTSKVLVLSLLLVSPLALARVQMHTCAEHKNSAAYGDRSVELTFQIDANETLEVYNKNDVCIVTELLAESEESATARFAISVKNAAGEMERIAEPVVVMNYAETATIGMSTSTDEVFTLMVTAQKA